ncbi:MAG: DUF1489 domain-containing protein [Proteobacteria bacterium]|nr:DUF1489 domain-containing protein [Pseudomonadota bacterium]
MTLHILKLSVGSESLETFISWHKKRLAEKKKKGQKLELVHVTRMTPKRADEVLNGGSLYWVIKGYIAVRTPLLELRPLTRNGTSYCGLVYDAKFIPTLRRAHRPFQGWRYFDPKDAPADARTAKGGKGLPEKLKIELSELGLL